MKVATSATARGYLVKNISTSFSKTIDIEYSNSSEYVNKLLPYIIHPVSVITIGDGLGSSTATYKYIGGYHDFMSREFRGFETSIKTKPDESIVESRFHQDDFRKGHIYQIDLREPTATDGTTGSLLSHTTMDWQTHFIDEPSNTIGFVKLIQKRTEYENSPLFFTQEDYKYDIDIDGVTADTAGNVREVVKSGTDAENITTATTYENLGDWLWRVKSQSVAGSASGKVRETIYDYYDNGTGNVQFETRWYGDDPDESPQIEYGYDGYGNITSVKDARGYITQTTYDTETETYPHTVTYPATSGVAHVEVYEEYDYRFGKPKRVRDRNGQLTYTEFDEFGRTKQIETPDGGQAVYTYDDENFPRSVTTRIKEQEGVFTESVTHYDGLGRKIQVATYGETPEGAAQKSIISQWEYDNMGRVEYAIGPFFGDGTLGYPQTRPLEYSFQHTTYDYLGRPLEIESPDGQNGSSITEYAYEGFSTTTIDPDGNSKTVANDYLGRTAQVVEHFDSSTDYTTTYDHNAADELVRIEDTLGNVTSIVYDSLGRKKNMTDPDMGFWSYTYDKSGNIETQTDAKAQTITFAYDELNRVTSKTYSTGDPSVSYGYDDPVVANSVGRLTSVSNSVATIQYRAYDPMGRVLEERKTIAGEGVFTTFQSYDLAGKPASLTFPGDSYQINYYYYPGSGLLKKVLGLSDLKEYATCSEYQPNGKMGKVIFGNNTQTIYQYDSLSTRLTSIDTSYNGTALMSRAYSYEPSGDIWQIEDAKNGTTYTYTYDSLHRLKTESGGNDPLSYDYNEIGNITSRTVGSMNYQYTGYHPNHPHAAQTINLLGQTYAYSYDNNGNMTSGPDFSNAASPRTRTIAYNADNMPTEIRYGSSELTSVAYDGNAKRVIKQNPDGGKHLYVNKHYKLIDGTAHKYFFAGNLRVAMVKEAETYYFHKDHLSSSTVMTRQDGMVYESSEYLPFGNQRGSNDITVTNYKFTDQEYDQSTELYNFNARLYEPTIGRFISPDRIEPSWYSPQTLNRYSYCFNNPMIYIDPTGQWGSLFNDPLVWISHAFFNWSQQVHFSIGQFTNSYYNNVINSSVQIGAGGDAFNFWGDHAVAGSMGIYGNRGGLYDYTTIATDYRSPSSVWGGGFSTGFEATFWCGGGNEAVLGNAYNYTLNLGVVSATFMESESGYFGMQIAGGGWGLGFGYYEYETYTFTTTNMNYDIYDFSFDIYDFDSGFSYSTDSYDLTVDYSWENIDYYFVDFYNDYEYYD